MKIFFYLHYNYSLYQFYSMRMFFSNNSKAVSDAAINASAQALKIVASTQSNVAVERYRSYTIFQQNMFERLGVATPCSACGK